MEEKKEEKMKIAIGDIHGHYDELMLLYKKIVNEWNFKPEKDQMIFLGDYVDGGYKTKNVINQLIEWQEQYPHWRFILGNHEDMLLKALNYQHYSNEFEIWYQQGGRATAFSYVPEEELRTKYMEQGRHATHMIFKEHLEWMNSLPLYYEDQDYIFVHAGVNHRIWKSKPGMENQKPVDMLWIRDDFIQSTRDFGKKVIYGHTAKAEPDVRENKVGIDTMFHNRGKLTALKLPGIDFLFQESVTTPRSSWDKDLFDTWANF